MLRVIVQRGFIAFCILQISSASVPLAVDLDNYHPLAELMIDVIARYVSPMTNTLNIMDKCTQCSPGESQFHMHLMEYFLKNFKAPIAMQFFNGESNGKPWEYNVFIVDTYTAFEVLISNFRRTLYEREFYFFIILTTENARFHKRHKTLLRIFKRLRNYRVLNVVVLNRISNATFSFYTYEYFTEQSCQNDTRIHEINQFFNGTLKHDYLFPPNRLTNFYNCTLEVCAHVLYPLLSFFGEQNNENHISDLTRFTGIDGDILKLLASTLQFRINLTFPQELNTIDDKGNGTGCLKMLLSNKASVAIGGLSNSLKNHQFLTASISYHQTPYVFVFRSGLRFSSMQRLATPFRGGVWASLGIILAFAIMFLLMLYLYGKPKLRAFIIGSKTHSPITNLITIFLGNPITVLPRRNFARFLLIAWILATLVLRNAYQAKLFDSLRTSERTPLPRTITQLIDKNYILLSSSYVDFYPINMTKIVHNLGLRYHALEETFEKLTTTSLLDTLAFYNEKNMERSCLTYMFEPIYHFQLVMYFQKHSVLRETFEKKLHQLISSGITAHIARKHVKKRFVYINARAQRLPQISNSMLQTLYTTYAVLIIVSLILFALELRTKKSKRIKRFLDRMHK